MADALASGASVLRDVGVQVPLRPQCDLSGDPGQTEPSGFGLFLFLAPMCVAVFACWLVVAGGVDGEFSQ